PAGPPADARRLGAGPRRRPARPRRPPPGPVCVAVAGYRTGSSRQGFNSHRQGHGMKIAFVLYDQFTALDLVGPYEVIARWPGAEVHFVATGPDPVRADAGLVVSPSSTLDSLTTPDLVLVPGSGNPMPVLNDKALLAWVRHVSQHARWMASVCTGASI